MNRRCWLCSTVMVNLKGDLELKIDSTLKTFNNVDYYRCNNCGEVVVGSKEAKRLVITID